MHQHHPSLNRYVVPDMPSTDELIPYLRQIDANRWYSNFGPLVSQFEERLQKHLSTPEDTTRHGTLFVTTLMTCYHALQIGLQLFRLPPQANVLLPAVTFPACPLAVQHAGATPVFADVEEGTWQLTPAIARRVAAKMPLHAVMPVAVYGVAVSADAWDAFTSETGIPVIIDAAAAFENQRVPGKCLLAHSFHATKPFSVGEGGALISRDHDKIVEARRISNFGTHMRIAVQDGGNAKMSEFHAAVGLAQLDRWELNKRRRRDMFARYRSAIEKCKLPLTFQEGIDDIIVSVVMLQSLEVSAAEIVDAMNAKGITAHRMYLPPLYRHPQFAQQMVVNAEGKFLSGTAPLEHKAGLMAVSEKMSETLFGLPFHAFLNDEDISFVMANLVQAVGVAGTAAG